jgi:hypothetical protein
MKNKLNTLFDEAKECKENKCKIDKEDINFIFKSDNGLKNKILQKKLFGNIAPKLCDCIIKTDKLILFEIKCKKVTFHILKKIKEQLDNVVKILNNQNIFFDRIVFIYDSLDNNKLKQQLGIVYNMRLKSIQYNNRAIKI